MPVKLLNLDLTNQITGIFETQLLNPVTLLYFYSNETCDTCGETRQLVEEITSLSNKLHIKIIDVDADPATTHKYNVELTPTLVVAAGEGNELIDHGIHFAGIPAGYEFGSLIQAILLVSGRDSGLKPEVRNQLRSITKPVHLQVFVTPT